MVRKKGGSIMNARKEPQGKSKKKTVSIKQMAAVDFQPVEPGHTQTMTEAIKFHASILMLAFGCLNKTREQLIEMWMDDDLDETNRQFVKQLQSTQEWLRDVIKLPETAEMRMMAACAASTQKQKQA